MMIMKRSLILVFVVSIILVACEKNNAPIVLKREISYRVTGTAQDYYIEYIDELGYYRKATAKKNWEYTFKAKPGAYVFLSAKNNTSEGQVKVDIRRRGERILSDESFMPFGIATVSGTVD
jgi:hypothetical protein